ncbi:H-2 class I histocompatibility antigen, Q10 alpha chain-like isoform X2 [Sardina pilchardus]|uniref:H-2 class I histocompatibility antigen, Q10 alpha chain-like isoform X2 n=1 Tax=Sardina pilchardus TaxID=27697 RepID=UPI002E0EC02F
MKGFVELLTVCAILPISLAGRGDPERHSLYYVYTALSKAVNAPGIFEFNAMGLLDNRKIDYYDSKHQAKIPQQDWMKEKLPADYWEKGTQSRRSKEQWFKVNVNILMERMRQNQSDIHVLMWKHGCEVDKMADGSFRFVRGVDAYSYDGNDFLSFDDASMQWVAPVPEAVPTKQKWDGVPILNQYTKGYLEKECVDWLEKFTEYGYKELKQQATASPPKVHFFAKATRSSNTLQLTCMATGFYPKEIDITILKGKEVIMKGDLRDVLPNGDGTHQIKLIVEAQRSDIDDYSCEMYYMGLEEPIMKVWTLAARCSNTLQLTCMATGFYPKEIDITILKGKKVVKKGDLRDVLPNGDGTHQIKLIVEAQRSYNYTCEVNHMGLEEPITKVWTLDGESCPPDSSSSMSRVLPLLIMVMLMQSYWGSYFSLFLNNVLLEMPQ